MNVLANGLFHASHAEDSLSVRETELSTMKRLGIREEGILATQSNLASTYAMLGRHEQAASMYRDVYSGSLKLHGEENRETLREANNYANSLWWTLRCFEEARSLLRKTIPVARRVLGAEHKLTLKMRRNYAQSLYMDAGATLDDLSEAVATLEDAGRIARRVLGGAHPLTEGFGRNLSEARAALRARDTPSTGSS